jgi:flagellar biosynthesis/type III secretory pathway M-ring protein FliF/YscJ
VMASRSARKRCIPCMVGGALVMAALVALVVWAISLSV